MQTANDPGPLRHQAEHQTSKPVIGGPRAIIGFKRRRDVAVLSWNLSTEVKQLKLDGGSVAWANAGAN
jgi:hypothetical protein